jgi:hypothetical protein
MPARGRDHFHSGAPDGDGWERAVDLAYDPGYGKPLAAWAATCPPPLIPADVDPSAKALRTDPDPDAWYGRPGPSAPRHEYEDYAQLYHKPVTGVEPDINWPPNHGAVRRTKLDYSCVDKFIRDFGDKMGRLRMDRLGPPGGSYLALVEDAAPASYEARAIHYRSLCNPLITYTLKPDKFPEGWVIRVMDTARALGQPGGAVGLVFLDEAGEELIISNLSSKGVLYP